jgi:Protein of unknown function (DUF3154).
MISLISTLLPVVGEVLDRVIPDEAEREKAKLEMEAKLVETANKVNLAQAEVNAESAKHDSVFVAGARPFLLWVCGFGFLYTFLLYPFLTWICVLYSLPQPPELGTTDILLELTLAMLGLAGLRTFEKVKGVSRGKI